MALIKLRPVTSTAVREPWLPRSVIVPLDGNDTMHFRFSMTNLHGTVLA
jgi:hypothetical protein